MLRETWHITRVMQTQCEPLISCCLQLRCWGRVTERCTVPTVRKAVTRTETVGNVSGVCLRKVKVNGICLSPLRHVLKVVVNIRHLHR